MAAVLIYQKLAKRLMQVSFKGVFSKDEKRYTPQRFSDLREAIKFHDSETRWRLNFAGCGLNDTMLHHLIPTEAPHALRQRNIEEDSDIARRVVSLNLSNNDLTDLSFIPVAHIMIESTVENNRIPTIRGFQQNRRTSTEALRELSQIKQSLAKYIQVGHGMNVANGFAITLSVLVGATMIAFSGACIAVAAGITWPIFTALAAAASAIGGSMATTLIGIAALSLVNLSNIALQSFFEIKKLEHYRRASTYRRRFSDHLSINQEKLHRAHDRALLAKKQSALDIVQRKAGSLDTSTVEELSANKTDQKATVQRAEVEQHHALFKPRHRRSVSSDGGEHVARTLSRSSSSSLGA